MLIPDYQRTTENIKKNIYDNIRTTFANYAGRWNAIWCIWKDNSPAWGGRWGSGNKGARIIPNDTIPVELRQTKTKAYEGLAGEVNPSVNVESNRIHTTGNENYIRGSLNGFNKTLIEKFSEGEYNSAGGFLTYKLIKSYGVLYQHFDIVENLISEQKYYVKEFERFDDNATITLYRDENCTNQASTVKINYWSNENHYVVKWTGERYYKTISVNPYVHSGSETSYSCPTLSSNNNNGISVSNAELGTNTYKLFNGVNSYLQFRKDISTTNPVLIYFQIGKSCKVYQYSLSSDNNGNTEYPIDWTLQGSNDRLTWTTIDTETNQSFSKNQSKNFSVSNQGYYLYYRLAITRYNNTGYSMELKRFTFKYKLNNVTIDYANMQPFNMGSSTSVDVSSKGVKTDSYIEARTSDYDKFSAINYVDNDTGVKIEDNQTNIYTYNVNSNWSLNNIEQNIRQDNIVKKEDYEQLQRLLSKINSVLKLRDGWFDSNGRCNYSCQVACQNKCQLSCQACNTKQCHNQKCGTH